MSKVLIAGGCSFTFGNELSDDDGTTPSKKSWAAYLSNSVEANYFCTAKGGSGNDGIARRIFEYISTTKEQCFVAVMWSFTSRYDWAMPRHRNLESTRWATITPWDTESEQAEVMKRLAGSNQQQRLWKQRISDLKETGVMPFANALYRYAANNYHETYQSWKNIIWLQNILQKKKIPYLFTLADNTLFYDELTPLWEQDALMNAMYKEIDFSNWYTFGERMMGFNQWATINDYEYGTTHPLDRAHKDAGELMKDKFLQLYKGE